MNMNKKLVIFDLDGTLADSIESITYCGNYALQKEGLPTFEQKDYKYFVGDGVAVLVKRMLLAAGDETLEHYEAVKEAYETIFKEYCMYRVEPYEGIVALLKELKNRGIMTAVLSNKPHLRTLEVIEALFGNELFDVVRGQMENTPKKPSPDGVHAIAGELDCPMEKILYLGDTGTDMQTGKSAGAFTIGVLWGFREESELIDNKADAIIKYPLDVLTYL